MCDDQCWCKIKNTKWLICWYEKQFYQVKHKEKETGLTNSADSKWFHWYEIKDNVRWFRWYLPDCRRTGKWCRTGFCRLGACFSQARAWLCHWENIVIFQAFLYKSTYSTYSFSLRISNIYLHWIVVILKTEGEVVVDLEHKRIEQMVSPEHLKVSCDESEPGWWTHIPGSYWCRIGTVGTPGNWGCYRVPHLIACNGGRRKLPWDGDVSGLVQDGALGRGDPQGHDGAQ